MDRDTSCKVYEYLKKYAKSVTRKSNYSMDLAHDCFIRIYKKSIDLSKLDDTALRNYIFNFVRNRNNSYSKTGFMRFEYLYQGFNHSNESTDRSWLDTSPKDQIINAESMIDYDNIMNFISNGGLVKGSRKFNGRDDSDIFKMYVEGYTTDEAAEKLKLPRDYINRSNTISRNKINKHFNFNG